MNLLELQNKGYTVLPIPAGRKGPTERGWTHPDYQPSVGESPNLGIRLDGLVCVDVDIDDPEMAEYVRKHLYRTIVVRTRANSSRVALLYRCPELETRTLKLQTAKWEGGRVEFTGGRAFQVLSFGTHPSGAQLMWNGFSTPDGFPLKEQLPVRTREEVEALCEGLNERLCARYGAPLEASGVARSAMRICHDLTPDMVFVKDGVQWTVEQLENAIPPGERWPGFNLTAFRPGSDSGAGVAEITQSGSLMMTDFVRDEIHFRKPPDGLNDAEKALYLKSVAAHAPSEPPSPAAALAAKYVFSRVDNGFIKRDGPDSSKYTRAALTLGKAKVFNQEFAVEVEKVQKTIWDPRLPARSVCEVHGDPMFNLYYAPDFSAEGGDPQAILRFLEHLTHTHVDVVLDWIAAGLQAPGEATFALLLYGAPGQGKSSVWQLLAALLEEQVSRNKTMEEVLRSPFDDHLLRRTFALFDEVHAADSLSFRDRHGIANTLKGMVDTSTRVVLLNAKYGLRIDSLVCATFGIATNHIDALPLDEHDRRFFVVDTQQVPVDAIDAFYASLARPEDLAAFARVMLARRVSRDMRRPPMTDVKRRMIGAGVGRPDEVAGDFLELVKSQGGFFDEELLSDYGRAQRLEGGDLKAFQSIVRRATHVHRDQRKHLPYKRYRSLRAKPEHDAAREALEAWKHLAEKLGLT